MCLGQPLVATEPSWSHVIIIYYKFLGSPHVIGEKPHVGETMHSPLRSAGAALATDGTPCTGILF